MLPATQKSLLCPDGTENFVITETPVPAPGPGEILVKVESAALNPADWKIQTYGTLVNVYPAVLGSDGSGTVVAVGEKVSPDAYTVGDRV